MKISGTNKEIVEIINLLDSSFKCKCDPNAIRFRCGSHHAENCLFEEELPKEYGTYVRTYHIEYNECKITKVNWIETCYPNSNILDGTVR